MPAGELSSEPVEIVVGDSDAGVRLDWFLARTFPTYSRVHLRKVINAAGVKVDDKRVKAAHRLRAGERIVVVLPEMPRAGPQPEDIPLEIVFEDDQFAVINKPPGMVVHPARGHWSGTLTSALQFHFDTLSETAGPTRPGIVHRLDRDTSGVLVVAKTDRAHLLLSEQFAERTVEKEYFALVVGVPDRDRDLIDQPIGPHPSHREKMAIRHDHSAARPAQTFYEVLERFDGFSAVKLLPKTGRTHQIRVHLSHIGFPVLCDRLYGGRAQLTSGDLRHDLHDHRLLLDRQALHARRLKIVPPGAEQPLEFCAALPADLQATLDALRTWRPAKAQLRRH